MMRSFYQLASRGVCRILTQKKLILGQMFVKNVSKIVA